MSSNYLPDRLIQVLRKNNDVVLDTFGIEVTLYIPTNLDSLKSLDVYTTQSDITYQVYNDIKAFINWKPNMYRLRNLGVFAENDLPITAYFPQTKGFDVIRRSYIQVPIQYVPNATYQTAEFEVVDVLTGPVLGQQVRQEYLLTPRRVSA